MAIRNSHAPDISAAPANESKLSWLGVQSHAVTTKTNILTITDILRAVQAEGARLASLFKKAYAGFWLKGAQLVVGSTTREYRDKAVKLRDEVATRLPIIKDKHGLTDDNPTYQKLQNLKWAISLLTEMIAGRHLSRTLDLDSKIHLAQLLGRTVPELEHSNDSVHKTDNAEVDCKRYLAWLEQLKFNFDYTALSLGRRGVSSSPLLFRPPQDGQNNPKPVAAVTMEQIQRPCPGPAL